MLGVRFCLERRRNRRRLQLLDSIGRSCGGLELVQGSSLFVVGRGRRGRFVVKVSWEKLEGHLRRRVNLQRNA
ncbi:hypothetical protein LINGRAHAP2_LOCUS31702 [Linum grandiflorum]